MNQNKFKNLINLTIKNIFRRKVRSILTILSVIIGIGAVMALILLSNGLFNGVKAQFDTLGSNTIFVMPSFFFSGGPPSSQSSRLSEEDALKIKDVDKLRKMALLEEVYYYSYKTAKVEFKDKIEYTLTVMTPKEDADSLINIMNLDYEAGEGLKGKTGNKVIIGNYFANDFFEEKIDVSNRIKINEENFKVVGILEPVGNIEDDKSIYITREAGKDLFELEDNKIDQMFIKGEKDENIEYIKEEVQDKLEEDHSENAFAVITANQLLEMIQNILNILKVVLISIASISVIVASIGIMNSIYTSVLERIKEIGVLKSIGARLSDIVFIFVSESIILAVVGGIIGLGFGYGIARLVEWYAISQNFDMLHIVITKGEIVITLLLSIVVGFISGILPARKASKLNPVDALRNNFN